MIAPLLFLLPVIAAAGLWLGRPSARLSRQISLAVSVLLLVLSGLLLQRCSEGTLVLHAFGNWRPPFGIPFAVDRMGALFVSLQALLLFITVIALRPETHGERVLRRAHPLMFFLSTGLFGAFMTGDLFNLFVMFELVLISSYLLLQVPGSKRSLAAAIPTILVNLVASLVFIVGLGVLYAICGSVNLADISQRIGEAPPGLRRLALAMLITSFGTKAALVPLCFWMPATYPTPSGPIAALFAGIMTKLGFYGLLRITPLLQFDPLLAQILLGIGAGSALIGVLAALSQYEMRRLLSFHSVSQLGYMVAALALLTPQGVAAAVFFALHHSLVKTALYLVADELERRNASRDLRSMNFQNAAGSLLPLCFGAAAFALAGLPPFSGFFGKLGIFQATWEGGAFLSLALLVAASFFTLASMLKIWRFAFQRVPSNRNVDSVSSTPPIGAAPVLLVVLVIAMSFTAGPVLRYTDAAAKQLLDIDAYAEEVLSLNGHPGPSEGED